MFTDTASSAFIYIPLGHRRDTEGVTTREIKSRTSSSQLATTLPRLRKIGGPSLDDDDSDVKKVSCLILMFYYNTYVIKTVSKTK